MSSSDDDDSDPEEEIDKLTVSSTSEASTFPDFSESLVVSVSTSPVNMGVKFGSPNHPCRVDTYCHTNVLCDEPNTQLPRGERAGSRLRELVSRGKESGGGIHTT